MFRFAGLALYIKKKQKQKKSVYFVLRLHIMYSTCARLIFENDNQIYRLKTYTRWIHY